MKRMFGVGRGLGPVLADRLRLLRLAARMIAGRRFWVWPLAVLAWPPLQLLIRLIGDERGPFSPASAQVALIGLPLIVLAIGFGVRIIAGEIDRRTLEIAYTVPGGAQRVWRAKLTAALWMLLAAEALLAVVTFVFFTDYPVSALYGALQGAVFYLVVAMAASVLFKSEATGALVTIGVLVLNGLITGFGEHQGRLSPLWNSAAVQADPADVLGFTVQNRIGMLLVIAALTALAFARAERREAMLGG